KDDNIDSDVLLQIGIVPYSNAWPLTHFLSTELPGSLISVWPPSGMRLRLMAHHLDIALMPVAELMSLSYGKIIGDCGISCCGTVESVRLISRRPIEKIRTLSLDVSSRSSIILADVMLRHFWGIKAKTYKLNDSKPLDECKTDAFVVIGDRALSYEPSSSWEHRYDLGQLWHEKTELPFVFAAWIACTVKGHGRDAAVNALRRTRNRGVDQIESILNEKEQSGVILPLSREKMVHYLTKSIQYEMTDIHYRSIQLFFDLCLLNGLCKHRTVLEIVE
ncbi:MAG: menaquinone biosynthetic enzyme MqnA/MqnD family protein, partial [Thermoguttaceae bacterium]